MLRRGRSRGPRDHSCRRHLDPTLALAAQPWMGDACSTAGPRRATETTSEIRYERGLSQRQVADYVAWVRRTTIAARRGSDPATSSLIRDELLPTELGGRDRGGLQPISDGDLSSDRPAMCSGLRTIPDMYIRIWGRICSPRMLSVTEIMVNA